jgi:hypothetical protein
MVNESLAGNVSSAAGSGSQEAAGFLGGLSWQFIVLVGIVAAALVLILAMVLLRPKARKSRSQSPFFKALFLTLIALMVVVVTEGVGWFGPDGLSVEWKVIGTILLFASLMLIFKTQNREFDERVKKIFPEKIKENQASCFGAELNVGESSGSQIPHYVVLPNLGYGGDDVSVVHYLAFSTANKFYHYVFGLKSGIMLAVTEDPAPDIVYSIFKKRIKEVDVSDNRSGRSLPEAVNRLNYNQNQDVSKNQSVTGA